MENIENEVNEILNVSTKKRHSKPDFDAEFDETRLMRQYPHAYVKWRHKLSRIWEIIDSDYVNNMAKILDMLEENRKLLGEVKFRKQYGFGETKEERKISGAAFYRAVDAYESQKASIPRKIREVLF
jgi:hypothetical protein